MQRKGGDKMMNKQREAFSLIMAVVVIVLMATVAMLIMTMSGKMVKTISNAVATPESPLNIIVDVFVSYPDADHPDDLNMTYHRRSLQKI